MTFLFENETANKDINFVSDISVLSSIKMENFQIRKFIINL